MCSALPAAKAAVEKRKLRTIEMMGRMPASVFKPGRRGSNEKPKNVTEHRRRRYSAVRRLIPQGLRLGQALPHAPASRRQEPGLCVALPGRSLAEDSLENAAARPASRRNRQSL